METGRAPLHIVIVGGGTAGWMAANLFAAAWPRERVRITLVESPEIGIIGVGEGSTPLLRKFFGDLGIDERDWMPRCNATYKLNIRFRGAGRASLAARATRTLSRRRWTSTHHARSTSIA